MNIGQVETLLGMTRANIRYYEQEGLVFPRREANGYRDYSAEDVDTLRKIKLLRQLGLSLEVIRQLQQGECTLDAALTEREQALEHEQAELDWAAQMCRQIRLDRTGYESLDAGRYLERLDRPADQPGHFDLRRDALPTVPHPWRRYFARSLDLGLYEMLWLPIWMLVFRLSPPDSVVGKLVSGYVNLVLMLVLEPLLLSTWGTTPGKAIFGLEVRDENGAKLTYRRALDRIWVLFEKGMGYGIPFYDLYRNYKSFRACSNGETLPWDAEQRLSYTIRDTRTRRAVGYVAADGALLAAAVVLALQSLMPIHRGAITPAEYADNINDIIRYQELDLSFRMEDDGAWSKISQPGVVVFALGEETRPNHQLTVEDGVVTAVRLEVVQQGEKFFYPYTMQPQLAVLAFGAARGEYNCISWTLENLTKYVMDRGLESYTLETHGLRITQEVEQESYEVGGYLLFAEEEEGTYLHWVFTIERV